MTAFVFVDTNVLVYARDSREPIKRGLANEWIRVLWNEERGRTSYQVLNEYYDFVTRKLKTPIKHEDAWEDVQFYLAWSPQPVDLEVLRGAHEIQLRYQLNWWDSLVVSAAQAQECVLLLSEDLHDGADYGGVVVRSPFTLRVAEEAGAYTVAPRMASRHRGRGRPRTRPQRATATS
jgi:predicted nucleic acid-binding protein